MNLIKQHWKNILFVLLIIFSLNKCTVACNRDGEINKQKAEIVRQDSIIKSQADSLKYLNIRFTDVQTSKTDLKDIALGNKQELELVVNTLRNENVDLNKKLVDSNRKIKELINENKKLVKENQKLQEQLIKYNNE